jgi:hypothetical protein
MQACAPVSSKGTHVAVAKESAVIIWDEKAKIQHFIRRAAFDTKVPYFGFLVPTPTQPELAEAPDELFTLLEDWTKPEERTEKRSAPYSFFSMGAKLSDAPAAGSVTVLDQKRVAGYDAVVVKATDGQALREWLEKHGYDARPALTAWLEPYIKAGWIITAFQIAKADQASDALSTQAVRMSFQAERPFFPYREPSDQREKGVNVYGRLLRLHVIAPGRMHGAFDDPAPVWTGRTVWAGPLGDRRRDIQERLGTSTVPLPQDAWLTVFDDPASPRPWGADVFFSLSSDQSELRRPPIIHYDVSYYPGIDLIVLGLACLVLGVVLPAVLVWQAIRQHLRAPSGRLNRHHGAHSHDTPSRRCCLPHVGGRSVPPVGERSDKSVRSTVEQGVARRRRHGKRAHHLGRENKEAAFHPPGRVRHEGALLRFPGADADSA